MSNRTFVIGVGMTKFEKPGTKEWDYPDMAKEAGEKALDDAGIAYDAIEQAYAGYCYGDSTCGQRARLRARPDRHPGLQRQQQLLDRLDRAVPRAPGGQGRARRLRARARLREDGEGLARREVHRPHEPDGQARRGDVRGCASPSRRRPRRRCSATPGASTWRGTARSRDHFAWIGWKNHKHSVNNPYAQFQDEYTLEEIKAAQDDPRAAHEAAVLADLGRLGAPRSSLASASSTSTTSGTRPSRSPARRWSPTCRARSTSGDCDQDRRLRHVDGGRATAPTRRRQSAPDDVDVFELHDCFSANELITYEALGLRRGGQGPRAGRRARRRPTAAAVGRQPVRRPDLEGPPARRDRPGAVLGAHLAAARPGRQAPGRRREGRASSTTSASAARPS